MARRRYLLLYDISDERRLRRVAAVAETFGYRMQYSVFVCDLAAVDLIGLKWQIGEVIDWRKDSVVVVDLGNVDRVELRAFEFLGRRPPTPPAGAAVF